MPKMPRKSMWWNPRTKVWSVRTEEQEKQRHEGKEQTRTNAWENQQQAISRAKILAEFANLQPSDIENFRADHPKFFPERWWDYRAIAYDGTPSPEPQWQRTQRYLWDAWLFEFDIDTPLFDYLRLLTSVFDPADLEEMAPKTKFRPSFAALTEIGDDYPYHLAVKWLTGQAGWRAKTCSFCEKRFIAQHPNGRFCSFGVTVDGIRTICSWAYRKGYKKAWWDIHSESVNERRRENYEQQKTKAGTGRSR